MRDSRGPAFLAKYGRLYQNEIDSLPARIPGEFREMVNEPIDDLFYEDIYQDVLEEYSVRDIRKILKDSMSLSHIYLEHENSGVSLKLILPAATLNFQFGKSNTLDRVHL